jgi:hypothetical protein
MLVMTLYFVIKDIVVWILVYVTFWLPFTSSFFMLFGNREACNSDTNTCQTVQYMDGYNTVAFGLYLTTFGTDLDRDV